MLQKASSQNTKASLFTMNATHTVNQINGSVDRANFMFCCIIVPPSDIKVIYFIFFHPNVLWSPAPAYSRGPLGGPQQNSKETPG